MVLLTLPSSTGPKGVSAHLPGSACAAVPLPPAGSCRAAPRMGRRGRLIWQAFGSPLPKLHLSRQFHSALPQEKDTEKRDDTPPFSTLKGERTTLPLRQCWKSAEQHRWRIALWPSANSFICLCLSVPSCTAEIITDHRRAVKLNSVMPELLGHRMLHDCERYDPHLWQPFKTPTTEAKAKRGSAWMHQLAGPFGSFPHE